MDFVEEFEDSKALPPHIVATYTFFKDFSVNTEKGVIRWSIAEHEIGTEKAELFKNLLKYFRSKLKAKELNKDGCGRAMIFWFSKLQEIGCFSLEVQAAIRAWMEICELIVC